MTTMVEGEDALSVTWAMRSNKVESELSQKANEGWMGRGQRGGWVGTIETKCPSEIK